MEAPKLRFTKVRDVKSPCYGTDGSAGIDFFIPNRKKSIVLSPQSDVLIPSGIKADIPEGYMLLAANKTSIAVSKEAHIRAGHPKKIVIAAPDSPLIVGAEVADSDYQGEIFLHLINVGNFKVRLKPGQKILQMVLVRAPKAQLEEVQESDLFTEDSQRGNGAFGSTNK